jgi:beta-glucosidase/6-phospho-beta-glucosidase/beta-galactosidase
VRIDELRWTGHDKHLVEDYRRLREYGIRGIREGIRWDVIDKGGILDFSSALPYVDAAISEDVAVIWDLFHFGYPVDLDPFGELFVERLGAYSRAFACLLISRGYGEAGVRFYTPVNEISFLAWSGAEVAWFPPFTHGRGPELKRNLARASIHAINCIQEVDPGARFVHCDPITRVHAPFDEPELEDEARYFNSVCVFETWDMLCGRLYPELGGSPNHLDIVGVNYYAVNQWEHKRADSALAEDDPRRVPFSVLLTEISERYNAPMLVSETASTGPNRSRWIENMVQECLQAILAGVDLHGVCLYPVLGMYEWNKSVYLPMGLWDCTPCGLRIPENASLTVLRRWQEHLEPVTPSYRVPVGEIDPKRKIVSEQISNFL